MRKSNIRRSTTIHRLCTRPQAEEGRLQEHGRGGPKALESTRSGTRGGMREPKLAGVAVDAVSTASPWPQRFGRTGEWRDLNAPLRGGEEQPDLVEKWRAGLPLHRTLLATLNSAVFYEGSFLLPGACAGPMELSNTPDQRGNKGQFERTLIVAEAGSYVRYLEGCTLHPRLEPAQRRGGSRGRDDAQISTPVQNCTPGTRKARAGSSTSSPSADSAWDATQDLVPR